MEVPNKVHQGKFLLCRILAPWLKMTAIMNVVDDPEGLYAVRLSIYNYAKSKENIELSFCGSVLAVRNHWFKSTADGGYSVRCDNPEDVVAIKDEVFGNVQWKSRMPEEKVMNSSEDCRMTGNALYGKKRFSEAVDCYSKGIGSLPDDVALLSNRCAAYLSSQKYNLALADAESALRLEPLHCKATYRIGKGAMWFKEI